MAKKKKYYVVWQGIEPGIYDSWSACQQQIKGFPAAKYKSFSSGAEARAAFHGNFNEHIYKDKKPKVSRGASNNSILKNTWSVDAACSGNPGLMEYRGVETDTGVQLFHQGPFKKGTNNIGEFLAIVHALALLQKLGDHNRVIYTDSKTAMAWVRNKKVKTVLKKEPVNAVLFDLIDRAIQWLENNTFRNKIIKWETKEWGEIPADFGRK